MPHVAPDRLDDLKEAMEMIADAVDSLPRSCRDLAGNALLNVAAETVALDVGCAEAGRIFARLAVLLDQGHQPPLSAAVSLTGYDA
jgi:hypothetical protein